MSFLGEPSSLSSSLSPLVAIDIINMTFAGINLPDFLLYVCLLFLLFLYQVSPFHSLPPPPPRQDLFYEEMCSYVSFSFL